MISWDSRKWFLGDMGNQARHQLTLGDRSLNKTTCQFIFLSENRYFRVKNIGIFETEKGIDWDDGWWVFFHEQ